uniref:triacylglycerol lipase n=1 Tax=Gopherus evgoodei TaxID=1825980 RepID=A0A8C4VMA8_9SAUR
MFDRERGWSVSFAGCGFLGVYHIGAATCLQERAPHLIRDARRIFGASAGALTGAVLVGGGSLAEACADVLGLAKEARKRSLGPLHPSFNVIKIIRDGLFKNLPENTHQLSAGKLCISLTRVSDGKNVLVSNFNSKEEIVQALICSSFVPIYCGLIPPSFRGVRYVDGGISDNLPQYESKNTITISPFSGECDICPKGNSANFHEMNVTNTSIQFSLGNLNRLTQALFPPEPKNVLHLKKNPQELIEDTDFTNKKTIPQRKGTEEILKTKMLSNQLKLNTWPLNERIFEHLPPRLRKALQEACKEKSGFCAQVSKLLPMRMMSYLILPYTLPVESAYSVALSVLSVLKRTDDLTYILETVLELYVNCSLCSFPHIQGRLQAPVEEARSMCLGQHMLRGSILPILGAAQSERLFFFFFFFLLGAAETVEPALPILLHLADVFCAQLKPLIKAC